MSSSVQVIDFILKCLYRIPEATRAE